MITFAGKGPSKGKTRKKRPRSPFGHATVRRLLLRGMGLWGFDRTGERNLKRLASMSCVRRAAASIWSEDKQQAAYRWLWWQQYWWQVALPARLGPRELNSPGPLFEPSQTDSVLTSPDLGRKRAQGRGVRFGRPRKLTARQRQVTRSGRGGPDLCCRPHDDWAPPGGCLAAYKKPCDSRKGCDGRDDDPHSASVTNEKRH
jgi:hypothetical protein